VIKSVVVAVLAAGLVCVGPSSLSTVAVGAAAVPAPAIAAGGGDTCARSAAGAVKCWGYNGYGELGDGTTTNRLVPTTIAGLTGVTAISTGTQHTCAVLAGATVKCWGRNAFGEVGDGTTTNRFVPTAVAGLTGVSAIAAGADHTCTLVAGGTVDCWGDNAFGQVGDGTTTNRSLPTAVAGLSGVSAITAGHFHTCALLATKTVRCWGSNAYGQLGDGTTAAALTPVTVPGLTGVGAIFAGNFHTCALSATTVKCWGDNALGQLGDGTSTNRLAPKAIAGLSGVSALSTGAYHTCALVAAKTVDCWGDNAFGQLGNGTTTNALTPSVVSGLSGVSAIAAGNLHTCALSTAGTKCWGYNAYGQIGDGTTTNRLVPQPVSAPPLSVAAKLASLKLVNYYPHDHGWSQMWTSFDPTEIAHDFGVMQSMGANSVRIIIQAYSVGFPQPSATGLSELSQMVALAHSHGLTAQLSLFDWFGDWPNISGSTTWAKAILAPYKSDPRISFVEVRNELDVTSGAALQWAKTMVPIVHAAAGTLPVTISIPGNAPSNALQIMKQTFGSSLDFYDVHYYGNSNGASAALAADKATVAPSPLYVGESGMSTGPGGAPSNPTLEQKQVTFFTQLNAATKANGLGLPSPWALQDFTNGSLTWVGATSNEYHFGLLRTDGSAKPAFAIEKAAFGG
jgi:alpha-tubulin suppressor-like RCC1 family protein